jgi:HEAT repeat protein
VTALVIDSQDEQIVYAATNIWLGTNTAHLTPLGVAVSVDGGRQWLLLSRAQLGDAPVQHLAPVAGKPLTVLAVSSTGSSETVRLALSPELLGLLLDGNPAVRASAARAIGLIGDVAALPNLLQGLTDPDALAGQRMAEAIGRFGDHSTRAYLLHVLATGPVGARTNAALALGLLASPVAVPGLAVLLNTGDPGAQRAAAEALAAIGTPSAIAALMAPLADPQRTSARHAATGGLEIAGQRAVAPLVVALLDANAVVRANAAEMLGWVQPIEDSGQSAEAAAGLARLLSDLDPTVRIQAAWALQQMHTQPARVALNSTPVQAPVWASILAPFAARPVALAPLAALPAVITEISTDYLAVAVTASLFVLGAVAMLGVLLIWRGKRRASRLGHS